MIKSKIKAERLKISRGKVKNRKEEKEEKLSFGRDSRRLKLNELKSFWAEELKRLQGAKFESSDQAVMQALEEVAKRMKLSGAALRDAKEFLLCVLDSDPAMKKELTSLLK